MSNHEGMEIPKIENPPISIPIEMYQVSGHGDPDSKKYLRDKKQDNLIRSAAKKYGLLDKIQNAPEQEQVSLWLLISEKIKQALFQKDPTVQREAAMIIWYAPAQEQVSLIKQALSQKDPSVQREAAVMIECAPAQERVSLQLLISEKIKQALSQKDPAVQREAVGMIWYAPGQKRISLVKIASDAGLGNEIVKPPLYYNSNLDRGRFKREKFHKTGSETTLVGGALKDKLIIRHIKPRAFLAWQKIYENYQVWQDNGFDYVPIEPIQSYRLNKKGMVDVFSGVLDLSLAEWSEISGNIFIKELEEQRDKIISILIWPFLLRLGNMKLLNKDYYDLSRLHYSRERSKTEKFKERFGLDFFV